MGLKEKIIDAFLNKHGKHKGETASNVEVQAQYATDLFRTAQDRYSIVRDINFLCGPNGDIRFQRANALIGEDATKGGFSIVVTGSNADRKRRVMQGKAVGRLAPGAERVQKVLDDFLERTQLHILCAEHAKALLRDGDLFLNVLVDLQSGFVLRVKRAPALTIKKNVDQYGDFFDPERAFSQVDANEIYKLARETPPGSSRMNFALYQMNHIRWLSDETKIYGTSQYGVSRKCYRMLEEMEKALAYRRMYRSVSKRSHKLESANLPDVEEYKRANAMVDQHGNPTRNAHMLTDYIGNVAVTALHDEANLDEIKDVELMENTLWINLLAPKAIITGGQGINRDVLKVQYPHYLQNLETITDRLEYGDNSIYSGYRAIIDLQLMLAGMNPEAISYDVVWSQKTYDTTLERVESIQKALGSDGGKQLISHEKAVQLMAADFDVEDPAMMYQKILEETKSSAPVEKEKAPLPEGLKDEAEEKWKTMERKTKQDIEREIGSFRKKWNSFFDAVYQHMLYHPSACDMESVIATARKAINEKMLGNVPGFYMDYMVRAGMLGAEHAYRLSVDYMEKQMTDEAGPQVGPDIRIEREDIYQDLLHFSGERICRINDTTLKRIREELAEDFDSGIGWKGIMERLKPIILDDTRAELIARTEIGWAYNRSGERVYQRAGFDALEWISAKGLRTCDACHAKDGAIYPINAHPELPGHPRCMCTWGPAMLKK